jgi:hypothetical protein
VQCRADREGHARAAKTLQRGNFHTFVTEWAWTATSKHERVRALAANLVLSVAAVHALREPQKPNPFLRAPH